MIIRVLVLNPPFLPKFSRTSRSPAVSKGATIYYPIWLAYAVGVLEKNGFEVSFIDAPAREYTKEHVIEEAKKFKPSLVVLDTSTPSIHNDVEIAELLKDVTNAFVVLVGTHPSSLPEQTLKMSKKVDAVARHEYDYTILELAKTLESGGDLRRIKGISFRYKRKIVHNPDRPFVENLDALPFVSEVYKKHLVVEDYFYAANLHPIVTILSGRGCPFRCVYCLYPQTFTSRKYRFRYVKNFVDELEYIVNNFPQVKEIFIEDDTFTANRKRCIDICKEIIRRKLGIIWSTNSRADMDYKTLKMMKKAGCRLLCVGYESGVQEILDEMHKGLKINVAKKFTKDAKKVGLLIHGCFLLGLPGDTKETIRKTIEYAKEIGPDTAQFFPMMVYPGTEAYEWAKKNGYLLTEDYSKWLNEEGLHNTLVSRPGLTNEDLVQLCDKARREFYLRKKYITYKIKQMLTQPKEIKRTLKSGKTFFRYLFSKNGTKD